LAKDVNGRDRDETESWQFFVTMGDRLKTETSRQRTQHITLTLRQTRLLNLTTAVKTICVNGQ